MTKSEYKKYLCSSHWKNLRKEFLKCSPDCYRCHLPRWLAVIAYDQDLHVHHITYENLGHELREDLEALCRRCHELETFGFTELHRPSKAKCMYCGNETWNTVERICQFCEGTLDLVIGNIGDEQILNPRLSPDGNTARWIMDMVEQTISDAKTRN
jgi:hypothetical protein